MKKLYILFFISTLIFNGVVAQNSNHTYVDDSGIIRWPDGTEVQGFGVNYTVPFAHAYRSAKKLGIDPKEAIDDDIYHFARLGFDAYRVHVWDTEISDTLGNLLTNENLDAFDYMLFKMKERNMKFLLTPIAFWGNGWPEPNDETPGFSHKYGKEDCLTNPDAIEAQANYLAQFVAHVNPYTGLAYQDDPDIIAFEVSNEPHHGEAPEKVTAYVQKMVDAMKAAGCKKPIFYNVSHSIHLMDAYYDADIEGGTFQWYPTGLGAQEEIGGNLLPNVDKYDIPFKDQPGFKKGGKIVYEFDAADVGRSYIYPAMARSFRTAGIQWATHFAYDPTYLAYANTEYNTHYMNLVYTPQKALSLKLASEVFHRVPIYKDYGKYPQNATFDGFRVSYEEDLAELVTDEKFIHTNHTSSIPNQKKLNEIAGFGNSPLVKYEGLGAYFLDRIEKGVWRLEVLPDAVWTKNPFGRNSLKKTLAVIQWNERSMEISLKDLGAKFSIQGINDDNETSAQTSDGNFVVQPGTYLLSKNGKSTKWSADSQWKNIKLGEFFAPESTVTSIEVVHKPVYEISSNEDLKVSAKVVAPVPIKSVNVQTEGRWRPQQFEMKKGSGFDYSVTIPKDKLMGGAFRYFIVVETESETVVFPGQISGSPADWDFYQSEVYSTKIVEGGSSIYVFDAQRDFSESNFQWRRGVALKPKSEPGKSELVVDIENLEVEDSEGVFDHSVRYFFGQRIEGRKPELTNATKLVVSGKALNKATPIQVALITKNSDAFGATVTLAPTDGDYELDLKNLKPVKIVTLPRPYPGFLPYYFEGGTGKEFDINDVESIQISLGPGLSETAKKERQGYAIESIRLE